MAHHQGLTVSLRNFSFYYHYIRHKNGEGLLEENDGIPLTKLDSAWRIVPGLYDHHGISFESVNYPNHFLRHQNAFLFLHPFNPHDELMKKDATFFVRQGLGHPESNSFEASNFPGCFISHVPHISGSRKLKMIQSPHSEEDKRNATFAVAQALHHS
eukprot:TRINITY_DN6139_c0_g1_i1.p1 TRINITY_DN6139_c0_g1~~TRINITY_DN6139_c0_g1_i1.p1  ORF type:complete len:157 (-),score=26.54 TRINITY_DN6139_c0_g1_i1:401-871(-)